MSASFVADKIAVAFATVFNADPELRLLAPGGCWHRRATDEEHGLQRPYALVAVTPGEKEFLSDYSGIQSFEVTVAIYAGQDVAEAGQAGDVLASWDFDRSLLHDIPGRILGLYPAPESLTLDPEVKLGADVIIAAKTWNLMLHVAFQDANQTY